MDITAPVYSVTIPVFNEEAAIPVLYSRLKNVMESLGKPYELMFVDDGSADASYDELKRVAMADNTVRIFSFSRNFGQHTAIAAAFLEAKGDYIITMDSDLQNPPEEIPKLLAKIEEGYDMVSGRRKVRKDRLSRRLSSLLTNIVIRAVTGLKMADYGSMLRVFKKDTARALVEEFRKTGGYITMLVAKVTRNVAEIQVAHDERYSGESKYSMGKLFIFFFRILFCYNEAASRLLCNKKDAEPLFIIKKRIENGKETVISG